MYFTMFTMFHEHTCRTPLLPSFFFFFFFFVQFLAIKTSTPFWDLSPHFRRLVVVAAVILLIIIDDNDDVTVVFFAFIFGSFFSPAAGYHACRHLDPFR